MELQKAWWWEHFWYLMRLHWICSPAYVVKWAVLKENTINDDSNHDIRPDVLAQSQNLLQFLINTGTCKKLHSNFDFLNWFSGLCTMHVLSAVHFASRNWQNLKTYPLVHGSKMNSIGHNGNHQDDVWKRVICKQRPAASLHAFPEQEGSPQKGFLSLKFSNKALTLISM